MRHPFRRKNLSPRLAPFYAVAVAAMLLAQPTALGFAIGGTLVLAGAALRAWGAGHLVKNRVLTVSGPYAHLRHPLYAGALLLGVGFAVIARGWAMVLILGFFVPVFAFYYLPHKDRVESARLERLYGPAFAAYRAAVPMLIPALAPWTPPADLEVGRRRRWSRALFRDNDESGTLLGVALALGLLALRPVLAL